MQNTEKIWQLVDARKDAYEALSDRVWEIPEICYTEYRSVAEHHAMLEEEGFRITENLAGIPTAVMGEAGEGGPVIAILGEYDALPGLSQVAGIAEPKEVEAGAGHGAAQQLGPHPSAPTAVRTISPPPVSRAACATTAAAEGVAPPRSSLCGPSLRDVECHHVASPPSPRRRCLSLANTRIDFTFKAAPPMQRGAATRPERARRGRLMNVGVNYIR